MNKLTLILIAILLLSSCDGNNKRRALIGSQKIVKDYDGNYYIIKHSIGGQYKIEIVDKEIIKMIKQNEEH